MPKFSERSLKNLQTVHQDLQKIMHYAIQTIDFAVIYGYRTEEQQFNLFKRGRKLINDEWVIVDKKRIVTYKDGKIEKSKHQLRLAVDIVPYFPEYPHIRWSDHKAFHYLAGHVLGIAHMLRRYGDIDNDIEWGGQWKSLVDLVHFQIA